MGVTDSVKNFFRTSTNSIKPVTKKESGNVFDYMSRMVGGKFSTNKFARDIFTQETLRTHDEKRRCKDAYRENSFIQKGVNTLKNVVLGKEPGLETNNEVLKDFYQRQYKKSSGYESAMEVAVLEAIVTGDGYIEQIGEGKQIRYSPVYNSEDIYIDYDYERDEVKQYILRINQNLQHIEGASTHSIYTPYGIETVYGTVIEKENMIHLKWGVDAYGVYGRSPIASSLNDIRILNEVERAMAVIAKYKAIPKKLLYNDNPDNPLQAEDIQTIVQELKTATDYENPIINRELKELDLSYGGKDINLQPFIDYLKRKITIVLVPEFIVHGENVNRSTSKEQKQEFYLEIASIRNSFETSLTYGLKKALVFFANQLGLNNNIDFTFKFGEFDIELPDEKIIRVNNLWNSGIMTLKEAREELGLREIEGVDIFSWEAKANQGDTMSQPQNESIKTQPTTKGE